MRTEFADSTFYVALLLARDSGHGDARALAASWTGRIVTSDYVLTEVANHLSSSPLGRQKFGKFLTSIESDHSNEVVASSRDLWSRGVALFFSEPIRSGHSPTAHRSSSCRSADWAKH